jgi:hypothetical protein
MNPFDIRFFIFMILVHSIFAISYIVFRCLFHLINEYNSHQQYTKLWQEMGVLVLNRPTSYDTICTYARIILTHVRKYRYIIRPVIVYYDDSGEDKYIRNNK